MPTQFAPPGESAHKLMSERTVLAGIFIMCVSYGAELLLYIATVYEIMRGRRHDLRNPRFLFSYVSILFALATIATGCSIQNQIWHFVDNRNFPGGPISFSLKDGKNGVYLTELMAFNLMAFLQDGYLLYRFLIIWSINWWAFIFPFLLYLSSVATSFWMWGAILKTGEPFTSQSHIDLGTVNWALSISTNIILTLLIILRILLVRRDTIKAAGKEHVMPYMSVVTMLVESQAIYAVVGIVVLASFNVNILVVNVLANTFGILEAFAPTLVVYMVARGSGWKQTEGPELSTLMFVNKPSGNTSSGGWTSSALKSKSPVTPDAEAMSYQDEIKG